MNPHEPHRGGYPVSPVSSLSRVSHGLTLSLTISARVSASHLEAHGLRYRLTTTPNWHNAQSLRVAA